MTTLRPVFGPGMHPVELGKYYVITPSIFKLFSSLCIWIQGMRPGCIVYGFSRIGKTRAIDALVNLLPEELSDLAVIRHSMLEHQKRTEKEFFRNILSSIMHERAEYGNAGTKRDILVDYITEQANLNPQKRVVLFIDEAQWIKTIEYGYLRGVYNSLDERGITPMFVLVGDRSLHKQYLEYKTTGNREIMGRFMSEKFEFNGVRGEDEVKLVLHSYDTIEAPQGSGWSFTRYYFPSAFDAGWRLTSQSKNVWSTFSEIMKENNHGRVEIYMSDLAPAVQYFLTMCGDLKSISPVIGRDFWHCAFRYVGIPEIDLN